VNEAFCNVDYLYRFFGMTQRLILVIRIVLAAFNGTDNKLRIKPIQVFHLIVFSLSNGPHCIRNSFRSMQVEWSIR